MSPLRLARGATQLANLPRAYLSVAVDGRLTRETPLLPRRAATTRARIACESEALLVERQRVVQVVDEELRRSGCTSKPMGCPPVLDLKILPIVGQGS